MLLEPVNGRACHTYGGAISLQASLLAAIAHTAAANGAGVSKLSGKAVVTVNHLTVDDYTASHTGPEGNHDEILQTFCGSVCHLSHRCRVGVVGKGHGQPVQMRREHLGEGDVLLVGPGKIGGVLYLTGVVVAVWSAYAYSAHLPFDAGVGDKLGDGCGKCRHKFIGILMLVAIDGRAQITDNTTVVVETTDIAYFKADGNYTLMVTFHGSEMIVRGVGSLLEKMLDQKTFVRADRSTVVNIHNVARLLPRERRCIFRSTEGQEIETTLLAPAFKRLEAYL